jgi:hypothetical protein
LLVLMVELVVLEDQEVLGVLQEHPVLEVLLVQGALPLCLRRMQEDLLEAMLEQFVLRILQMR